MEQQMSFELSKGRSGPVLAPGRPLSQEDRLFVALMRAGEKGLTTADFFQGQGFCAKYTSRLSDGSKRGHRYDCRRLNEIDGVPTEQRIYFYRGFEGDRQALRPEVLQALNLWEVNNA